MSVDTRRSAAPARTAARNTGTVKRSLKLTATWLTIVAALTFFTLTVVSTAAAKKPDYADAIEKLTKGNPHGDDAHGNPHGNDDSTIILTTHGTKKEVCVVDDSQLGLLQSRYDVGRMTVRMDGDDVEVVTVDDANPHELHILIGDMNCELVKEKRTFYLPFDPPTTE